MQTFHLFSHLFYHLYIPGMAIQTCSHVHPGLEMEVYCQANLVNCMQHLSQQVRCDGAIFGAAAEGWYLFTHEFAFGPQWMSFALPCVSFHVSFFAGPWSKWIQPKNPCWIQLLGSKNNTAHHCITRCGCKNQVW